ncbi:MAG: N-acetyl-gamma-glutamyl-phosphate reductase [Elusimicrobia bacterium]|nr:N-acetyl-gamma-glutamyl-phosphate reductase [Elusimicrobiota bacterium]
MNTKKKTAVVGASGFTGRELVRLIARHPGLEISSMHSKSFAGQEISDIHPSLKGIVSGKLQPVSVEGICGADVVFLALPHTSSLEYIPQIIDKVELVVDLSADYRFSDPLEYKKWYNVDHKDTENLKRAVYGIPEINRGELKGAKLIANPGCYATSVILAVYPLLKEGLVSDTVYVDAKSGISGAGKKLDAEYLFSKRYESITPYKVDSHRHMGEIICFLDKVVGTDWNSLVFCPHLIPIERGILANLYIKLNTSLKQEDLRNVFLKYYRDEHFINVLEENVFPETKEVGFTNNCNIGVKSGSTGKDAIVISAIDNLIKGASGQALQNMNAVLGFPETAGLV